MVHHESQDWVEAQKIFISIDLIATSRKHLQFLEAVDNNGNLYDGPILERAIFRYKYCWLPLLAKHTEAKIPECQLVVPLDCEWIWHCHRLNPIRYMEDCEKLFGRILDPGCVVVSSIEGACKKRTEEIWKEHYPEESYELDFNDHLKNDVQNKLSTLPTTSYDLISAVKRQSSFFREVSSVTLKDDSYLEEAVKRYKGFLYLIKKNMELNLQNDCVPTYDIDLMWHSHQLRPISYRKDALALVGKVLHHDDSDSNQSPDGKLGVGGKTTTKQWEEIFGFTYLKALSRCMVPTTGKDGEKLVVKCRCLTEATSRCMVPTMGKDGEKLVVKCRCSTEATSRCMAAAMGKDGEKMVVKCRCPTEATSRCMAATMGKDAEKLVVKCQCPTEATSRCMVPTEATSRCMAATMGKEGEKLVVKCRCPTEATSRCMAATMAKDGEKLVLKCRCPTEATSRCMVPTMGKDGEKLVVKCRCPTEATSRCMAATIGKDGEKLVVKCRCPTEATSRCMAHTMGKDEEKLTRRSYSQAADMMLIEA